MNAPVDDILYDAIVVGSGAGGAAAAATLARAGLEVLLLEKGGELPDDGSTLDFRAVVGEGRWLARETWHDGRGRAFMPEEHFNVGGKTRWYGAALLRYDPHEFAADRAHGCDGWPLPPRALDGCYQSAEQALSVREFPREPGLARLVTRLEALRAGWRARPLPMGLHPDIVGDEREARHFDGFASAGDLKHDARSAFLAPVRALRNLRLVAHAEVAELLADPASPTRVDGVRLADGRRFRARHVLLAAGALHSPRLLQRFVERHGLGGRLACADAVGRHLKLHLLTAVVALSARRQHDLLRKTTLLLNDDLPHSSVQPLGFDGELIATLMPGLLPTRLRRALGDRAYGFFLQTEDGSHPDNRVRETTDGHGTPTGAPVMDYDSRRLPAAEAEHRALVFRLMTSLAGAGWLPFSKRIGIAGTAHACGTLAAGDDPSRSVVAADGHVHGLQSLHVVDGSVLTRSSRVNPSLTIFAWSLHVSRALAARLLVERRGAAPDRLAMPA